MLLVSVIIRENRIAMNKHALFLCFLLPLAVRAQQDSISIDLIKNLDALTEKLQANKNSNLPIFLSDNSLLSMTSALMHFGIIPKRFNSYSGRPYLHSSMAKSIYNFDKSILSKSCFISIYVKYRSYYNSIDINKEYILDQIDSLYKSCDND